MPSSGRRLAWIVPILGLVASPAQAQFCYIDHVSRAGHGIELHFVSDSNVFVRISKAGHRVTLTDRMYQQKRDLMHRLQPNALQPDAAASKVVLFRGEEAFVGGGVHSGCFIQLAIKGRTAGVNMQANVGLPGLPPQTSTRFLPIEEKNKGSGSFNTAK
jgi:hypothetical protein